MKPDYPTLKVKLAFARGRAVLYEDYLAIEHVHSFGMSTEDSRTYYDEIRWVFRYQRRDWHRLAYAILWAFPFGVGMLLATLPPDAVARAIGTALAIPTGIGMLWSAVRFIATPRTVAAIVSPRGIVEIGTDWPRSSNKKKDAGAFFETFLSRLELVAEMPAPPAPPAPPPWEAKPSTDAGSPAPPTPTPEPPPPPSPSGKPPELA